MSDDARVVAFRLRETLIREVKLDAAMKGEQLQEWYSKATEERLRRNRETADASS
jgi:hypothetical protein